MFFVFSELLRVSYSKTTNTPEWRLKLLYKWLSTAVNQAPVYWILDVTNDQTNTHDTNNKISTGCEVGPPHLWEADRLTVQRLHS